MTKFQNLKVFWTPASNLAFPNILSRNVTNDEYKQHRLQDKKLPRDVQFSDERVQQITHKIKHEQTAVESCNDFYPIHCHQTRTRWYSDGTMTAKNFHLKASVSYAFSLTGCGLLLDGKDYISVPLIVQIAISNITTAI